MGVPIEIKVLGRFSVRRGGEEIPPGVFGGRLPRLLLRVLVMRRGSFVSRDALAEALWSERPPADPAANLNVMINRVRRALMDPSLVVTGSGGYSFASDDRCLVDAEAFLAGVEAGRRSLAGGRPAAALGELQEALAQWGGEPLAEDAYADWAAEHRRRLARAHLEALEQAGAAAIAVGEPDLAVGLAEQAVSLEPLREPTQLLLVRALAASGDTGGALAAFDTFRRRFADELGLDLSAAAQELLTTVLRGEPVAPAPRRGGPAPMVERPRQPLALLPFVGREHELGVVLAATDLAHPGVVLISGEAGSGKSRLLAELVARLGTTVMTAKAFLPEREHPWALARSLLRSALTADVTAAVRIPDRAAQALADIVPELEEVRRIGADAIDPESRRALALEGGVRLIDAVAGQGAVIVADDLQWADATSLSLLGLLVRRVATLGVVLAYRPEEVSHEGALGQFLAELPSLAGPPLAVSLPPLRPEDVAQVVCGQELADAINESTERTPFAVGEVVAALVRQEAVERCPDGRWRPTTERASVLARQAAQAGQRHAVEARVNAQPAGRRELLSLLALLGREAPARLFAIAGGLDSKAVLDDLDALASAGLVRLGEAGWTTGHDLISETVTEALGRAAAGRLHDLLASGLRSVGADPSELGRHLAGAGDLEAAAGAFAEAAQQRLDRHASAEAERLAEAGLRYDPSTDVRLHLLELRAEGRARRGDFAGAREDLRAALAGREGGADRSRVLARMAMLAFGSENLARAAELAELAIGEAGDLADARAQALFVGAIMDMNARRQPRAKERFDEALALFEQAGNARGIADILDGQAMAALLDGELGRATDAFDRVADRFVDAGELLRVVTPRASRGLGLVWMGRPAEALVDIDEALDLARTLGYPEGESYGLFCRSEALAGLGRAAEGVQAAQEALAIAQRLGHGEWTATAYRGLGIARQAAGDAEGAADAFRSSLAVSEEHRLPHFESFAAARLALVLIGQGNLADAEALVARSLATGLPLSQHEARLAQASLAAAREEPGWRATVAEALERARAGDHAISAAMLQQLLKN